MFFFLLLFLLEPLVKTMTVQQLYIKFIFINAKVIFKHTYVRSIDNIRCLIYCLFVRKVVISACISQYFTNYFFSLVRFQDVNKFFVIFFKYYLCLIYNIFYIRMLFFFCCFT